MYSSVDEAVAVVEANGLIVLPTDTVYGIGVSPILPENIDLLLSAKGRDRVKPPPVLVSSVSQVLDIAVVSDSVFPILDRFWPGALTVVLPMRDDLGWDLGLFEGSVAVRMPNNELALEIISRTGPLAVTSANLTGLAPAVRVGEAVSYFGSKVGAYVDGGLSDSGVSSTIVDLTVPGGRVLRVGDVSVEMLREFLPDLSVA